MASQGWDSSRPNAAHSPKGKNELQISTTRGSGVKAAAPVTWVFEDSVKESPKKDYEITEKLGMGAFGVVKKGIDKKSGKEVAIKSIRKADCKPDELRSEVGLLRLVGNYRGIVSLENVYESPNRVNIVMEYISGGELFDAIVENEFYSEKDAAALILQIVTTVEYVHQCNVVHRDIKPENLLFEKRGSSTLKLIDFGIATTLEDGCLLLEVVGSRTYMAPEIDQRKGYGKPVDVYAIGVIMYILLCGYPPFDHDQGIFELAFGSPEWDEISDTAKSLIETLLDKDPTKRPNATQLKRHPWVSGGNAPQRTLTNNIHKTLSKYIEFNKIKTKVGGRHQRRVSIYGIFNIGKQPNPGSNPLFPSIGEEEELASPSSSITTSSSPNPKSPKGGKPETKETKKEEFSETDLLGTLSTDLSAHSHGFEHLRERMQNLSEKTKSQALKKQLVKTIEEVTFLSKEYETLVKQVLPVVKKSIPNSQ